MALPARIPIAPAVPLIIKLPTIKLASFIPAGLSAAVMHSAATLGPLIGELLAHELIDSGAPSALLSEFRPERFSTP